MKHERKEKMNERIARVERAATTLGVGLSSPTKNSREFSLTPFRTIRFKTQGKGTMLIEARHCGVLEASNCMRDEKVIGLLRKAAEENVNR